MIVSVPKPSYSDYLRSELGEWVSRAITSESEALGGSAADVHRLIAKLASRVRKADDPERVALVQLLEFLTLQTYELDAADESALRQALG